MKNPIYEMEKSNLRNETLLYYYWEYPKYEMEKSNLRNKILLGLATQISNLRNDQSDKGKCPINEMDL